MQYANAVMGNIALALFYDHECTICVRAQSQDWLQVAVCAWVLSLEKKLMCRNYDNIMCGNNCIVYGES